MAATAMIRASADIEKCSSPIGDGNRVLSGVITKKLGVIEKCSSPIGDGNEPTLFYFPLWKYFILRNVAPR